MDNNDSGHVLVFIAVFLVAVVILFGLTSVAREYYGNHSLDKTISSEDHRVTIIAKYPGSLFSTARCIDIDGNTYYIDTNELYSQIQLKTPIKIETAWSANHNRNWIIVVFN